MQNNPGEFHWNELMTRDVAKAKAFYGAVCGWTFQDMEVDDTPYTIAMAGDKPAGGIFGMSGPEFEEVPEHWGAFVAVADTEAAVAAAKSGGGQIIREPFDVTGVGRIAIVMDPSGAVLGVIKPAEEAE